MACPPEAGTRQSPPPVAELGLNKMMSSEFHVPPRPVSASARVRTSPPPVMSIRFTLPPPKKPIDRLSGDQNGNDASVVPVSGRADPRLSGTSKARGLPPP